MSWYAILWFDCKIGCRESMSLWTSGKSLPNRRMSRVLCSLWSGTLPHLFHTTFFISSSTSILSSTLAIARIWFLIANRANADGLADFTSVMLGSAAVIVAYLCIHGIHASSKLVWMAGVFREFRANPSQLVRCLAICVYSYLYMFYTYVLGKE